MWYLKIETLSSFLIFSLLGTVDPFGYRWRKKIPSTTYAIASNSLAANGMLLNV